MRCLVLIALVSALCAGCGEKVKPVVVPISDREIPAQESWRSTVTFSDSARVKAVLWAGYIAVYDSPRRTLLSDSIHVDFFNDAGEHSSTLTARRGKVDDVTRNLEAYENVVVKSDSGTTLTSDRLFWNNAEQKIHTDAFVDIVSPTEHISGQGMVSDQSLKNYRIFKVTGRAVTNE